MRVGWQSAIASEVLLVNWIELLHLCSDQIGGRSLHAPRVRPRVGQKARFGLSAFRFDTGARLPHPFSGSL